MTRAQAERIRQAEVAEYVAALDRHMPPAEQDEPPPWDETPAEVDLRDLVDQIVAEGRPRPVVRVTGWTEQDGRLSPAHAELTWDDGSSLLVSYARGAWTWYGRHEVAR